MNEITEITEITANVEGGPPVDLSDALASVGVGGRPVEERPEKLRTSCWEREVEPKPAPVEMSIEALVGCDYHAFGLTLRGTSMVLLDDRALRTHIEFLGEVGDSLIAISSAGGLRDFSREEQESARVRAGNQARSKMNTLVHQLKNAQTEERRRAEARRPKLEPEPTDAQRIEQLEARLAEVEQRLSETGAG